jgi:hypothetical protein
MGAVTDRPLGGIWDTSPAPAPVPPVLLHSPLIRAGSLFPMSFRSRGRKVHGLFSADSALSVVNFLSSRFSRPSGKRLPAVGAETVFRISRLAASRADGEGSPAKALARRLTIFLEDPPAAVAFQKMLTPFDRNEGNKEKA